MSYLEKKVAEYDAFIKKCMADGKIAPKPIKDKFLNMSKQKFVLLS